MYKKIKENIIYHNKVYEAVLEKLCCELNNIHRVKYTNRYWEILLGHWLKRAISTVHARYISSAMEDILSISASEEKNTIFSGLIVNTSRQFLNATSCDKWNAELIRVQKILMNITPSIYIEPTLAIEEANNQNKKDRQQLRTIKNSIKMGLQLFGSWLSKDNDAFIMNTYLRFADQLLLTIKINGRPSFWESNNVDEYTINLEMRERLLHGMRENKDGFEGMLNILIPSLTPACYLEGYQQITKEIKNLKWPKKPRFIYTCNNFDENEIFKYWLGSKIEEGVPYYVGQHGANYGTFEPSLNFVEIKTCDKFITWGWETGDDGKYIPGFIFKTLGKKSKYKRGGDILISCLPPLHETGLADVNPMYGDHISYRSNLINFIGRLDLQIKRKVKIRLHKESAYSKHDDRGAWERAEPSINIEDGSINIERLIAKSQIILHTYDSTGMLETLALNIPTLSYWSHSLEFLTPESMKYYQLLIDANIIIMHNDPEVDRKIISILEDVELWWRRENVQAARKIFCDKYAKKIEDPIKYLSNLLIRL
jgi:putative transferase (TIGR04331 family)